MSIVTGAQIATVTLFLVVRTERTRNSSESYAPRNSVAGQIGLVRTRFYSILQSYAGS